MSPWSRHDKERKSYPMRRPSRSRWPMWPCPGRCSRRSWGGSVGCERCRARDERSPRAGGGEVQPRRTGMVRREVRVTCRRTDRWGPSGCSVGHPTCRTSRSLRLTPGHGHSARVQYVFRRAGNDHGRRDQRSSGKSRLQSCGRGPGTRPVRAAGWSGREVCGSWSSYFILRAHSQMTE